MANNKKIKFDRKPKINHSKTKFNVVDVIVIVLIIACIGGIYVRYNLIDKIGISSQLKSYEITFNSSDLRYTSLIAFQKDATVINRSTGEKIGIFKEIETTSPSSVYVTNSDGTMEKVYYPENTKIDVKGKIIVKGIMTDNGFLLDGNYYLANGSVLDISTEKLDITITVESLSISVEQE